MLGAHSDLFVKGLAQNEANSDAYENVILSSKISGMATDKRTAF